MKPDTFFDGKWRAVERCPACGGRRVRARKVLPGSAYLHGDETIDFPAAGIPLETCAECTLRYKGIVPQPEFLAQVFSRQAGKVWMDDYSFQKEISLLTTLVGSDCFDLLDVGPGDGALLRACARAKAHGRRSALDVVAHPGAQAHVSGEWIEGLLDSAQLSWSGAPYKVVTLFDLLEHLYEPQIAFQNLCSLVDKDGLVLIETGNIESYWPKKYGAAEWWYVTLFPHHIFWSRRALEQIAGRYGFKIMLWESKRHKNLGDPGFSAAYDLMKIGAYQMARRHYLKLAVRLGKMGIQPRSPFARDHFRVCLRKI